MRGVALCCAFCAHLFGQASLDGTAADSISRESLSGVHVRLSILRPGVPKVAYGAMSDETGHFSMAAISPGTYSFSADRAGFVYLGAKAIVLKNGQNLTDFKLEMTPKAVISGHLLDENGDPMPGISIEGNLASGHADMQFSIATDDCGVFRVGVAPGKYYVKAPVPSAGSSNPVAEIRADGSPDTVYVTTWFPSAPSVQPSSRRSRAAKQVELTSIGCGSAVSG